MYFIFILQKKEERRKKKKKPYLTSKKMSSTNSSTHHMLSFNRPFTQVTVATTTKLLYYFIKKTNGTVFSPLDITLIARHWEDMFASRLLVRNIFAVCASLFVDDDNCHMHMFVRARDIREEALRFLFNELIDNRQVSLDVMISDWGGAIEEFNHKRRQHCNNSRDQYHTFQERIRFVRSNRQ